MKSRIRYKSYVLKANLVNWVGDNMRIKIGILRNTKG